MSLADFIKNTWTVDKPVKSRQCSKAKPMDQFTFSGNADEVRIASNGDAAHQQCWQATSLHYDPLYDHLKGVMRDGEAVRYVCITFDRSYDEQAAPTRIHCYVSSRYAVNAPSPDDGTWSSGSGH